MNEWQRREEEKEKLKEKLCEREVAQKLVAVGSEEGVREWKLCRVQKTDDSGGTTSELCRCAEPVCPLTHQTGVCSSPLCWFWWTMPTVFSAHTPGCPVTHIPGRTPPAPDYHWPLVTSTGSLSSLPNPFAD